MVKIKRALISVYDKTHLAEFVKGLKELGVELISTGGTAEFIKSQGVTVKSISDLTGFPEILDGRVKTLHPKVHGALLSLRESHAHMAEVRNHGIEMIDMVVVNLYPFNEAAAKPGARIEEVLENIDIGGSALLRSAAKNYRSVAVICNPSRYNPVLEEMKTHRGLLSDETLSALAVEAFKLTSEYDNAINVYLAGKVSSINRATTQDKISSINRATTQATPPQEIPKPTTPQDQNVVAQFIGQNGTSFPEIFNLSLKKAEDLRYGENPHQRAAFYKNGNLKEASVSNAKQLGGKPLSFNNIMDMDAALEIVKEFDKPAASIIKHANPCGAAAADTLAKAYTDALECDRDSAYGGIVG